MLDKNKQTRIMVFGTFDGVHKGHLNFFKQAKNLAKNSFLIVSIARDLNVKAIKGNLPSLSEKKRFNLVKKLIQKNNFKNKSKIIDKVVLSGIKNYIPHILKENPDILALGYDQKAYVKNLKKDLESKKYKNKKKSIKIVRLKPYKEKIYKNSLLKK